MYLKVLLLDKSKENIKLMSLCARQAGYIPLFSQSEEHALQVIHQQSKELLAVLFSSEYKHFITSNINSLESNLPQLKLFELCNTELNRFERVDSASGSNDLYRIDLNLSDLNRSNIAPSDLDHSNLDSNELKNGLNNVSPPLFPTISLSATPEELDTKLSCPSNGLSKQAHINHVEQHKRQISGHSVLLVEDDGISSFVAKHILEEAKIIVSTANNGQEAVDIVASAPKAFDLILMDIQMPVLDGHSATQAIRELDSVDNALPIIAMTAQAYEDEKDKFIRSGMNDYIAKPINAEAVYSSLARWLNKNATP